MTRATSYTNADGLTIGSGRNTRLAVFDVTEDYAVR